MKKNTMDWEQLRTELNTNVGRTAWSKLKDASESILRDSDFKRFLSAKERFLLNEMGYAETREEMCEFLERDKDCFKKSISELRSNVLSCIEYKCLRDNDMLTLDSVRIVNMGLPASVVEALCAGGIGWFDKSITLRDVYSSMITRPNKYARLVVGCEWFKFLKRIDLFFPTRDNVFEELTNIDRKIGGK